MRKAAEQVPLMVSCSGFGLPMHAQLLRLLVTTGRASRSTLRREESYSISTDIAHKRDMAVEESPVVGFGKVR